MTDTPRPTRFAGESWRTASAMHARVVGAVIMRDLQTRFGAGYFGFLLGLLMPLGHLGIVILITTLLKRPIPLGRETPVFVMTGVLPFIIWLYSHRQIMLTAIQNRPLLYFPSVDFIDLFIARIIIEIIAATIVVFSVLSTISLLGYDLTINNPSRFVLGLILAWVVGISTGLIIGLLGFLVPIFTIFGNIMGTIFWITCGIFFLPDFLPESIRNIIFFNPLSHIIDLIREAVYSEYIGSFYDANFLISSILILFAISMLLMRIVRKYT
ncbi:ABC transporter permease [Xanthobacter autotrophicus]|uniref:ABC transporter permease n=1 Tax=Xanthobacter autotrophicus TaxID=280 RepID=UPI003729FFFE